VDAKRAVSARTPVNPTEYAILGLLAEEPRTGYDIKKEVEERLAHFWTESYGHIYPMLRRLRARRLVAVRVVGGKPGRPDRKLHTITAAGRRTFRAWFDQELAMPRPRNELLLRIILGRFAPPEALLRDVQAYQQRMRLMIGRLRAVRAIIDAEHAEAPDAKYWRLTLEFGTRTLGAIDEWCTLAADELRAG
jgi:DNA-binding PadR family transcriptional regulator